MTFKEVLKRSDLKRVLALSKGFYPKFKVKYVEQVYNTLIAKRSSRGDIVSIVIDYHYDSKDVECCYHNVYGLEKDSDEKFGIEFMKWGQWLGCKINSETLERYSYNEVVCHCIWEMTFYGVDDEDIQDELKDINRGAKEAMAMDYEDFVNVEDFIKSLKKK